MSEKKLAIHTLRLKQGRDKAIRQGNPWLFSGAVESSSGPADAPLARVLATDGSSLGLGFHSPNSRIRARLVGGNVDQIDRGFFRARLRKAMDLRQAMLPPDTDGYRLVNAEGDGLPGWTVDRYGDLLVSQITSAGLEAMRHDAYEMLGELLPEAAIVQSNRVKARRQEGLSQADETVRGTPPDEAELRESGLRFLAELGQGQKTGFYCDQRSNRRLAESLAGGRRVLDLFCHSGAFGAYALRGGAKSLVGVESAPRLLERAQHHIELNQLPADRAEWRKANVFEHLRTTQETWDLAICDPPPLVLRRDQLDGGARAYKDVNRLTLGRLAPGGYMLTFSCSAAVDARLFRQILFSAAREASVRLQLLRPLAAGEDHPVALNHPQGEYLKGWLVRVMG